MFSQSIRGILTTHLLAISYICANQIPMWIASLRGSTEIVIHRGSHAISSAMNEHKAGLFPSLHGQGECLPILDALVDGSRASAQASRTYKFKRAKVRGKYGDKRLRKYMQFNYSLLHNINFLSMRFTCFGKTCS